MHQRSAFNFNSFEENRDFFFCSSKERQFLAGKHYYLLLIFRISLAAITVAFVSQTSYLVGNGHGAWKMRKVREKKKSNEKKG